MPRSNYLLPFLALVVLLLFSWGLIKLLLLRYERGDVYPPYSTFRADPLGTRAYHDALIATGAYQVQQGFLSLHRELETKPDTLLYLGLPPSDLFEYTPDDVKELDNYVKQGGRVVITMTPVDPEINFRTEAKDLPEKPPGDQPSSPANNGTTPVTPPAPAPPPGQTQQEQHEREEQKKEQDENLDKNKITLPLDYHPSLAALWGFGYEVETEEQDKKTADAAESSNEETPEVLATEDGDHSLEASVPWKSALYFVRTESDWEVLYRAKDQPVIIRRTWGKGEIILATDSYFVSNEALRNHRCSRLLATLAGGPGNLLLFDETHLGTERQEGIMSLAEKFHLEGYLYGMVGVVLLFLWYNSVPLVPPHAALIRSLAASGAVSGKDSRSGLVNLLKRHITLKDILKVCFSEWKRGVTPAQKQLYPKMLTMEHKLAEVPTLDEETLVSTYHELCLLNAPHLGKKNHATRP